MCGFVCGGCWLVVENIFVLFTTIFGRNEEGERASTHSVQTPVSELCLEDGWHNSEEYYVSLVLSLKPIFPSGSSRAVFGGKILL